MCKMGLIINLQLKYDNWNVILTYFKQIENACQHF